MELMNGSIGVGYVVSVKGTLDLEWDLHWEGLWDGKWLWGWDKHRHWAVHNLRAIHKHQLLRAELSGGRSTLMEMGGQGSHAVGEEGHELQDGVHV